MVTLILLFNYIYFCLYRSEQFSRGTNQCEAEIDGTYLAIFISVYILEQGSLLFRSPQADEEIKRRG